MWRFRKVSFYSWGFVCEKKCVCVRIIGYFPASSMKGEIWLRTVFDWRIKLLSALAWKPHRSLLMINKYWWRDHQSFIKALRSDRQHKTPQRLKRNAILCFPYFNEGKIVEAIVKGYFRFWWDQREEDFSSEDIKISPIYCPFLSFWNGQMVLFYLVFISNADYLLTRHYMYINCYHEWNWAF